MMKTDDIVAQYMPSPWLSESIPRKSPYFPQNGDILMYFKQGHSKYLDLVKTRKAYEVDETTGIFRAVLYSLWFIQTLHPSSFSYISGLYSSEFL